MLRTSLGSALLAFCLRAAFVLAALLPSVGQTQVTCSNFNFPDINFSSVSTFAPNASVNGIMTFNCENSSTTTDYRVAVCLNIGTGISGGTNWNPKVMPLQGASGASAIKFQIYRAGNLATYWGSRWQPESTKTPMEVVLSLPRRRSGSAATSVAGSASYTDTIQSSLDELAALKPDTYSNAFSGNATEVLAIAQPSTSATPACLGATGNTNAVTTPSTFPFTASANLIKQCTVNAIDMDFGSVSALSTATISATGQVNVRCNNGVTHQVALEPSGTPTPTTGAGRMTNAGTVSTNPDTYVSYNLYRNGAYSQAWGNQAGVNTVGGTAPASGNEVAYPVYGRVNSANVLPGTYTDTVTVKVTY